jgi:hypothetical protein
VIAAAELAMLREMCEAEARAVLDRGALPARRGRQLPRRSGGIQSCAARPRHTVTDDAKEGALGKVDVGTLALLKGVIQLWLALAQRVLCSRLCEGQPTPSQPILRSRSSSTRSMVINGQQWSSVVMRGHQWSTMALAYAAASAVTWALLAASAAANAAAAAHSAFSRV